jgi:hypothetical protein
MIDNMLLLIQDFLKNHPLYGKFYKRTLINAYVDDILIAAADRESCELVTSIVYQILTYNQMYLPDAKIQQCQETVTVMGLKLHDGRVFPNDDTVEKLRKLKKPKTRPELISALGLLNYVRKANPSQRNPTDGKIGKLYDLSNEKGSFKWEVVHDEAWTELVEQFNLGLPMDSFSIYPGVEDVSKWTLVLQTDASTDYVGFVTFLIPRVSDDFMIDPATLNILDYNDSYRIINIGSKKLNQAERLYLPHDREALGIFWALSQNRLLILLFGECILQTDNKTALAKFIQVKPAEASTVRGRRWIRWLSDLADLLFCTTESGRRGLIRFCHIPGPQNILADYLSRYLEFDMGSISTSVQTDSTEVDIDHRILLTVTNTSGAEALADDIQRPMGDVQSEKFFLNNPDFENTISPSLSKWELDDDSLYLQKISIKDIYRHLKGEEVLSHLSESQRRIIRQICQRRFSLTENGLLIFKNNQHAVIVVPNIKENNEIRLRTQIIKLVHEDTALSCHRGELQTRTQIRRHFWWPNMDRDVHAWISSCVPCITTKGLSKTSSFNPRQLCYPNQLILCDWIGPLPKSLEGYEFLLIVVDGFSSFVFVVPFRFKSAENTAQGLLKWISLFGCPDKWASDNDSTFISQTISEFRKLFGIKEVMVPTYSPSTQGMVERAVRTIKEGIQTSLIGYDNHEVPIDWPVLIDACVFNANSVERFGNISPFEVMLGRKPRSPWDGMFGTDTDFIRNGTQSEYVSQMRIHLKDIYDFWASKSLEIKNKVADQSCNGEFDLFKQDDNCLRVAYINGRRSILGQVKVIRSIGTNSYTVTDGTKEEIVQGYQLILIPKHPDRIELNVPIKRDELFEIESVVDYDPVKGYLVQWVGFGRDYDSWQFARDMPTSFRKDMKRVREQRRTI